MYDLKMNILVLFLFSIHLRSVLCVEQDHEVSEVSTKVAVDDNLRQTKQFWPYFSSLPLMMTTPALQIAPGTKFIQNLPNNSDRKVVNVANTRAGTSIVLDNYRVQSIINLNNVTNKEELQVESRANDASSSLESLDSYEASPSPRRYGDDISDEVFIAGVRGGSYIKKQAKPNDCCLFVFLDGSAFFFDDFLRKLTGYYRLMYGTVNNHPHYVSRNCKTPEEYSGSCTYIWYSGHGWVIGVGRFIGQTKGVIFTKQEETCPSGLSGWRYLSEDLEWKDNGNILLECST